VFGGDISVVYILRNHVRIAKHWIPNASPATGTESKNVTSPEHYVPLVVESRDNLSRESMNVERLNTLRHKFVKVRRKDRFEIASGRRVTTAESDRWHLGTKRVGEAG
jgi:hypothetical protein